MPDTVTWQSKIPVVLEALKETEGDMDCRWVRDLLGVKKRRAELIMGTAGAKPTGRRGQLLISVADFCLYLRAVGGSAVAVAEEERRKRLAKAMVKAQKEQLESPRVIVDLSDLPTDVKAARRLGMAGLPDGVVLEPGRIEVRFGDPTEALMKLGLLAMAIGADHDGFDAKVSIERGRMANC